MSARPSSIAHLRQPMISWNSLMLCSSSSGEVSSSGRYPALHGDFWLAFSCRPNSLKDYRKFGSFLQTALVHFVQMTQTSYNATQTSYNATQTSYNLTSHNIRIHSYIIYIISMSAPNAIMLDARRTYPSAVRPSAERASLRQQRTICHISEHTKKQMM